MHSLIKVFKNTVIKYHEFQYWIWSYNNNNDPQLVNICFIYFDIWSPIGVIMIEDIRGLYHPWLVHITYLSTLLQSMLLIGVITIEDVHGQYQQWTVHITYPLAGWYFKIGWRGVWYELIMIDIDLIHLLSWLHQLRIVFRGMVEKCTRWTDHDRYWPFKSSIVITLIEDHILR